MHLHHQVALGNQPLHAFERRAVRVIAERRLQENRLEITHHPGKFLHAAIFGGESIKPCIREQRPRELAFVLPVGGRRPFGIARGQTEDHELRSLEMLFAHFNQASIR
jgi:hypothetical protein